MTRPTLVPFRDVPVFINSFNRVSCLKRLLAWLCAAGHRRIFVVDNASNYPPLIEYLDQIERQGVATVVRLPANVGHLAIWTSGLLERFGIESEYIYTDPDVVPAACCPHDVVAFLQQVLHDNSEVAVAGLGLRLDDIPDRYLHKKTVLAWERQFWLKPAAPGLFLAPIDTTFALYRPGMGHSGFAKAIRTGWPHVAAHEGWYVDHRHPSDEDAQYGQSAMPGSSHWSVPWIPQWLQTAAAGEDLRRPYVMRVGEDGDVYHRPGPAPDDGYNARRTGSKGTAGVHAAADGFYCESGVAPFEAKLDLWSELRGAAKPGARLVLHEAPATPCRLAGVLSQNTVEEGWLRRARLAGWELVRVGLTMPDACRSIATGDLNRLVRGSPGLVRQLAFHLAAVGRAPRIRITVPPLLDFSFGSIDSWRGFERIAAPSREITDASIDQRQSYELAAR